MAKQPILDLSTLIERPKIAIDGKLYDILSPDELSIADLQRVADMGKRVEELSGTDADGAGQDELIGAVDELATLVMVGVPPELRQRLSVTNMLKVIEVFTGLLQAKAPTPAPAGAAKTPTGENSFPASSASTEARPATGSLSSPPPSSGPSSS